MKTDNLHRLMTRRSVLPWLAISCTTAVTSGCARSPEHIPTALDRSPEQPLSGDETTVRSAVLASVYYLEVVTPESNEICAMYEAMYGVKFGEADQHLGGARTVRLANGVLLGVRAPMHGGERPVVRPYVLVDDIQAAVAAAEKAGAEIAVPPMLIPGHGTCAIVFHGGIESGLWQITDS
ncbi:MAG TPA: hypothetical protein PKD54_13510 [Pirellulaceae bacterium]|nr:hypothetical protein [Pirellulaceae bacterium]